MPAVPQVSDPASIYRAEIAERTRRQRVIAVGILSFGPSLCITIPFGMWIAPLFGETLRLWVYLAACVIVSVLMSIAVDNAGKRYSRPRAMPDWARIRALEDECGLTRSEIPDYYRNTVNGQYLSGHFQVMAPRGCIDPMNGKWCRTCRQMHPQTEHDPSFALVFRWPDGVSLRLPFHPFGGYKPASSVYYDVSGNDLGFTVMKYADKPPPGRDVIIRK